MKTIAVLASGSGSNLQRIIDAIASGEIPMARIAIVVADRDCFALTRAQQAGIPAKLIPRGKYFSSELLKILPANTDLIVLAGFLSILNAEFCERFSQKIINIHPALLPSYGGKGMWGANVHRAVIEAGEKKSGATVHYVTPGVDEGTIIMQKAVEITPGETPDTLASKIHEVEYEIFPAAIKQVLEIPKTWAFVTDFHFDEAHPLSLGATPRRNWRQVLADLQQRGITNLIIGGDVSEENEAYRDFFASLEGFSWNMIYGNHDQTKELNVQYLKSKQNYYCFESLAQRFVFLDTSSYRLPDQQMLFLKQQLETSKKVVIFMHHPVLDLQTYMDEKHPLENRDEVRQLLEASGRDIEIFCGHYHNGYRSKEGRIAQTISPAVSYQIGASKEFEPDTFRFGYTEINIEGTEISAGFILLNQNNAII